MINKNDLELLIKASELAGFRVDIGDLQLIYWKSGLESHIPLKLPQNCAEVYIFKWNDSYLKVGKVNSKSNARYQYQL
jgi:hypothetical protein